MKDKVICLSGVMSVKAIITAVICSLSEEKKKKKLRWMDNTCLQNVSFSFIFFRLIIRRCEMFGWILNSFPKPIMT